MQLAWLVYMWVSDFVFKIQANYFENFDNVNVTFDDENDDNFRGDLTDILAKTKHWSWWGK